MGGFVRFDTCRRSDQTGNMVVARVNCTISLLLVQRSSVKSSAVFRGRTRANYPSQVGSLNSPREFGGRCNKAPNVVCS